MTDNAASKALLAHENRAAGRVVPRWRYWAGYVAVAVAHLGGQVTVAADMPFWVRVVSVMIPLFAYTALIDKYKARSIT